MAPVYVASVLLRVPLWLEAGAAMGILVAAFVAYLFGRYWQQKVAMLALFGAAAMGLGALALLTDQASTDRSVDSVRVYYGRYIALSAAMLASGFINSELLIMHSVAQITVTVCSASVPLFMLFGSLVAAHNQQWLWIGAAIVAQGLTWWLGLFNTQRRDTVGWAMMLANIVVRIGYFLVWVLGPEIYSVGAMNPVTYAWLFAAFNIVQLGAFALLAYAFVESEEEYKTRKNIPMHEHVSTNDGQPLKLMP